AGGDGSEDGQRQDSEDVATLPVVAAAEHGAPHEDASDEGDAHGDGGGHRPDQDVAVADMAELVGQHAPQLVPVEDVQDALGDGHGGVIGVSAGGEGVGLHVGRDVELGHRHV